MDYPPICGDGVRETCEECDDGNFLAGDGCSPDCTLEVPSQCGNGEKEPGEECDDGNIVGGDGCDEACLEEGVCGNGILEPGEQCDDGNNQDGDACGAECDFEDYDPLCGDGVVEGTELCDDGCDQGVPALCEEGIDDGDGCNWECVVEGPLPNTCGNGIVEVANDEECDDGNKLDGDGCDFSCQNENPCLGVCCPSPCCGDGTIDPGEQCDDMNSIDLDGCSSDCQHEDDEDISGIKGVVRYGGQPAAEDTLRMLVYDKKVQDCLVPPEPLVSQDYVAPMKNQEYFVNLTDLVPDDFWIVAYMNKGSDDPGVEDCCTGLADAVSVGINESEVAYDIDIFLPACPGDPKTGGAVKGTLDISPQITTTEDDALRVLLSEQEGGDVMASVAVNPVPEFPYAYTVENVPAGEYYVVGFLDVEALLGLEPNGEDWVGAWETNENKVKISVEDNKTVVGIDFTIDSKP